MKKRNKKIFFSAVFILIFALCAFISYSNSINKKYSIEENLLAGDAADANDALKYSNFYTPKLNFNDMPVSKVNNITFNILDKHNIRNIQVLLKAGRYYIPLDYITNILGYNVLKTNNELYSIQNSDHKILLSDKNFTIDTTTRTLRGNLLSFDGNTYISISDIEQIFNLVAVFNFSDESVSLVKFNNKITKSNDTDTEKNEENPKYAFFRLEDFTCGDAYSSDATQTKVKIMASYLNSHNIKFHVAWIPRFKAPTDNVDNNLVDSTKIECVSFVNLLDYLINKGAKIGLHGYTHQHGDERSAVGEDLAKGINDTEKETRTIIESGIDTAAALNIPISFYESPHYYASDSQLKIIGKYFKYQYEPYKYSKHIEKTKSGNTFIPTPLGYVEYSSDSGADISPIIDGLNDTNSDTVKSFFYHPSIESSFIDFNLNNNKLNYKFHKDSPLKAIIKALEDDNYTTLYVTELK